jgi:ribosomal protein L12E/L44/L45/RPP1/RPP2
MADHAALYEYAQLRGLDYNELCRVFREACGGVAAARSLQAATQAQQPAQQSDLHAAILAIPCRPAFRTDPDNLRWFRSGHKEALQAAASLVAAAPQQPAQQAVPNACAECGRGEVINGKCDRCGELSPAAKEGEKKQ